MIPAFEFLVFRQSNTQGCRKKLQKCAEIYKKFTKMDAF